MCKYEIILVYSLRGAVFKRQFKYREANLFTLVKSKYISGSELM